MFTVLVKNKQFTDVTILLLQDSTIFTESVKEAEVLDIKHYLLCHRLLKSTNFIRLLC